MKTPGELDQAHALHPWTHFDSFEAKSPLIIARGEGCNVWDEQGRRYLDAVGGLWCTNIGLGRQEMADAISDQVLKLGFSSTFVDMSNEPAAEALGLIVRPIGAQRHVVQSYYNAKPS